jgi:hypothetical protein
MTNDWIVLEKVAKWAGLEDAALDEYLAAASDIHREAVDEHRSDYDFPSDYYTFLNQEVISSPVLVEQLAVADIPQEKLGQVSSGTVDFDEIVAPRHLVDYDLDEIVDFVMLLKLLRTYRQQTGEASLKPLEKLHYLVYLVNHRLSQEDDLVRVEDNLGLGNLQRTGYRYSFRKQEGVPLSQSLRRDKDRLVSWGLLGEQVLDAHQEYRVPFGLAIADTGEFFFTRYGGKLEQFESVLLKTWENHQDDVLQEFATSTTESIHSYLTSLDRIEATFEGRVILPGRPMNFTEQEEEDESRREGQVYG